MVVPARDQILNRTDPFCTFKQKSKAIDRRRPAVKCRGTPAAYLYVFRRVRSISSRRSNRFGRAFCSNSVRLAGDKRRDDRRSRLFSSRRVFERKYAAINCRNNVTRITPVRGLSPLFGRHGPAHTRSGADIIRPHAEAGFAPGADLRYCDGALSSLNIGAQLGWMVKRATGMTGRLLSMASV